MTRAWALLVHREKRFAGVRWWSYYDSRWGSYGLWDLRRMRAKSVTPLDREHAAVLEAAATLARPFRT